MSSLIYGFLILIFSPIPYRVSGAKSIWKAPITLSLVIVNTILFVSTHFGPNGALNAAISYDRFGVLPAELKLYTLVTYTFLHISVAHLIWNMFVLYLTGVIVEDRVGHGLFAALYFLGGISGGLLYCAISLHLHSTGVLAFTPLAGASGAISSIVGLFFVYASSRSIELYWAVGTVFGKGWDQLELPAGLVVLVWLAQNVYGAGATIVGKSDGVAYFAHIGGFIFGVVFGYCAGLRVRTKKPKLDASSDASVPGTNPVSAAAEPLFLGLLNRAINEGDAAKAKMLYARCRSVGLTVPAETINQMKALIRLSPNDSGT